MSIKTYSKLVRDNIPDIIVKDGKACKTHVLSQKEYVDALHAKLEEELKEYKDCYDIHELADIQEIINAIVKADGLSLKEFDAIREAKRKTNGGFDKKIFLESVNDKK